jgi:hypothetical protein
MAEGRAVASRARRAEIPHPPSDAPALTSQAPTARALREWLRRSPLLSPVERAHWLRLLPYLTADQRHELAELLAPDADLASR